MTRAPSDIGDKVVIAALNDTGPISYPLARIPNNVSYETVSDQPEAEPNQPLAIPLSFEGGLGYSFYGENKGAITSNGMLVHEPGIIRARLVSNTLTLTGAANPPNYFFETTVNDAGADDGQPVLYLIANEAAEINVYKISLDSGDLGTLLNTKTFAVTPTQPCGHPVEWHDGSNTKWYFGTGDNGKIQRLTTIVSGTAADTWTAASINTARHLRVVDNKLIRSIDANHVSVLPQDADPLEGSWGGNFNVGTASANITELGEASGLSYIAKEDGFYEWDLEGEAENVFPEIGFAPRNGQGMIYWHGGFLIPADTGLWWTRTGKPVGMDSNPNNKANDPSLEATDYFKHGRWMGLAPLGEYIYGVYLTSDGTFAVQAFGRERNVSDPPGWGPIVWHIIQDTNADFDDFYGVFITKTSEFSATETRPCLWSADGNNLTHTFLDKDGAPASRRGDIDIAASAEVISGRIDGGMPNVPKQLQVIEGWLADIAANQNFQLKVFRDGEISSENVGSVVSSDGFFRNFWTQDSNDTARSILARVVFAGSGSVLTDTNGPHLRGVVIRMIALPRTTREWTFLFAVEDKQSKTAKKIRSELEGYVGDLKKYTLPDKDTFNGVMGKPRLLRADEINALTPRNQEPPHYIISCVVREMAGS